MSFQSASRPEYGEAIEPINMREDGIDALFLPHPGLLIGEHRFWRGEAKRSNPESRLGKVATLFARQFLSLHRESMIVRDGFEAHTFSNEDVRGAVDWYAEAAVMMGYSRLLRIPKIFTEIQEAIEPPHDDDIDEEELEALDLPLFMDYMHNEPDKTGLHVHLDMLSRLELPYINNGKEEWRQDEVIYLRARRPAEPTMELLKVYHRKYKRRMDRSQFISFSGRMKHSVWTGEDL
jgi:hypothetical protein